MTTSPAFPGFSLLLRSFFKEKLKKENRCKDFKNTGGSKPSAAKFQEGENALSEWLSTVCCNK